MPPRALATTKAAQMSRPNLRAIDMQHRDYPKVSSLELGLIEQPTRPRSEYTAAIRRSAMQAADSGLMIGAADLTRAAMTESGYARGIISDLTHGLWGLPRTFLGRADMIADLDDSPARVGQFRELFPEPDAIRLMSWGITLGLGPGQMRPQYGSVAGRDYPISLTESENGEWKLLPRNVDRPIGAHSTRRLRSWDPKWLRYQWDIDTWWLMTADGEIRIELNDGEWLMYMPYGESKPWEYGAWKSLTLAFILARDAIFDRARHSEVLAPVRVGKMPSNSTEKQRQKFLTLIRQMQRMSAFVLPPGLEYEIVESTGRVADIYAKIIEWSEREFGMLTGAITTATGSPGFSKGDVQERFTRSILASLGKSLCSCLHRGGMIGWALDNYGSPDAPRAEFDTAAPEDKKVRAETLGVAGDSLTKMAEGLRSVGKRLSASSVERYVQSLGFEVEDIPSASAVLSKLNLGVDGINAVVRGAEARSSQGLPPFGDPRDDKTIAELMNAGSAPAGGAPPEDDEPGDPNDQGPEPAPGAVPPTEDYAIKLAAKMTTFRVARCEHQSSNRCRLCGVERVRDFDMKRGAVIWHRAWRPIVRAAGVGVVA